MPPNIEENFKFWKKIAGLPADFPDLTGLPDEEFDKRTYISDQEKIEEIDLRITNPLISVLVNKGHGCTTIYNYIFKLIRKNSLARRIIPIKIELTDFWDGEPELSEIDIELNIKKEILKILIQDNSWEKVLTSPIYNNIIGCYEKDTDKKVQLKTLALKLNEKKINWESLGKLCEKFILPLNEIILEFSGKHQIKIVLFFDIPYNANNEHLEALTGSIKDLHQHYKDLPGLSEIYFITPEHFGFMQSSNPRTFEIINYNIEGYYFNQIIKILSHRYRPLPFQTIKEIDDPLLIVFDQKFVQMAWSKEKTIHEIIADMKILILESLMCEKKRIPFKLEPTREQLQTWRNKDD